MGYGSVELEVCLSQLYEEVILDNGPKSKRLKLTLRAFVLTPLNFFPCLLLYNLGPIHSFPIPHVHDNDNDPLRHHLLLRSKDKIVIDKFQPCFLVMLSLFQLATPWSSRKLTFKHQQKNIHLRKAITTHLVDSLNLLYVYCGTLCYMLVCRTLFLPYYFLS